MKINILSNTDISIYICFLDSILPIPRNIKYIYAIVKLILLFHH